MYVWWGPHIIMKLFQVNINITKEYNTIEKDKICNGSILRGNSTNPPSFWEASKIFLPHATPLFTPTLTALQIQKTLLPSNFRQKGTQLEKRAPIKQNNAYRIVWKKHWNQSPKRNMKSNKGPNIARISLQASKPSIISFIPKIPHDFSLSVLYMPC